MTLTPSAERSTTTYPRRRPNRRWIGVRLRRLGAVAALCVGVSCAAGFNETPSTSPQGNDNALASSTTPPRASPAVANDDRDGDHIALPDDLCPDEPEDIDGFDDDDGCPDPDNDGDRIEDSVDECPNQPENFNGYEDEDGCPDRSAGIIISPGDIRIVDRIYFPSGVTSIQPRSEPILDAVAATLRGNPQILLVEVQSHTDERGTDAANLRTSRSRAEVVRQYLIQQGGVEPSRLTAVGYGERCPLNPRHNEAAWEMNRRVEFRILRTSEGPAEDTLPCPEASDLTPHGP